MSNQKKVKYNTDYNRENYIEIRFRIKKSDYKTAEIISKEKGFATPNAFAKSLFVKNLIDSGETLSQKIEIKGNVGNVGNVDTMHIINKK